RKRIARQQHLSLQLNQRRRHHQEVAGDRDVQLLHDAQVTQILVSDASDGNVINTDVLLPNEVQQQIQWAFKLTEQDLQIVCVIISDDVRNCARDVEWRGTLFRNLLRVIFVHRQIRILSAGQTGFLENLCQSHTCD